MAKNIQNNMRVNVNNAEVIPVVTGHVDLTENAPVLQGMELAAATQTELMIQDKLISSTLRAKRLELQAANVKALKEKEKADKLLDKAAEEFDKVKMAYIKHHADNLLSVLTAAAKDMHEEVTKVLGDSFKFTGEPVKPKVQAAWQPTTYVVEKDGKLVPTASFRNHIGGADLRDIILPSDKALDEAFEDLKDARKGVEAAQQLIDDIQEQAANCCQLEEELRLAADQKACELLDPTGNRRKAAKAMADSIVKVPVTKQLATSKK